MKAASATDALDAEGLRWTRSRFDLTPGPQGPRGEKGETGEPGPFPPNLPSGKAIAGVYDLGGTAAASHAFVTGDISYLYKAPGQIVRYLEAGTTDLDCRGTYNAPTAPPGFTCIYEEYASNVLVGQRGVSGTRDTGVLLYDYSANSGQFGIRGTWAATGR